jgi:hypothetical protein
MRRLFSRLLPGVLAPTVGLTAATVRSTSRSCFAGWLAMGRSSGMRTAGCVGMRSCSVGIRCYGSGSVRPAIAAGMHYSCVAGVHNRLVGYDSMVCCISAPAGISSSTSVAEAVAAPAVAIAPTRPRAHAEEDTVIEVARPVEADRRATVWRIVIVAIGTDRWNAYVDGNLRMRDWR